jgi:fatty-acyl-CoA synthase/long-chain acyl-CoA synthetase
MDLLSMYADRYPYKPAVIDDRPGQPVRSWSFADLERRTNQLAHFLLSVGVGPTTKVCWCGQNSGPLMFANHAVRKIGGVTVPLNYRLTPDEAAYVVDNCDAEIVYVDAEYEPLIRAIRSRTPKVREVLVFDGDGTLEGNIDGQPDTVPPSTRTTPRARAGAWSTPPGRPASPRGRSAAPASIPRARPGSCS